MAEDWKPDANVRLAACCNEPQLFVAKRRAAIGLVAQAWPGRL